MVIGTLCRRSFGRTSAASCTEINERRFFSNWTLLRPIHTSQKHGTNNGQEKYIASHDEEESTFVHYGGGRRLSRSLKFLLFVVL